MSNMLITIMSYDANAGFYLCVLRMIALMMLMTVMLCMEDDVYNSANGFDNCVYGVTYYDDDDDGLATCVVTRVVDVSLMVLMMTVAAVMMMVSVIMNRNPGREAGHFDGHHPCMHCAS